MIWREFEILGAYRDSGEPALLRVEAASEDDAIEYAASRGVLISRVVDRSPPEDGASGEGGSTRPPVSRSVVAESHDAGSSTPHVRFSSRVIPDLDLLPGERTLARFDATPSEIGLAGMVLAYRRRLVVTSNRVIVYDRRTFGSSLKAVPLARVSALVIGARVDRLMLAMGAMVLFGGSAGLVASRLLSTTSPGALLQGVSQGPSPASTAYGALAVVAGILIMLESRSRVIGVEAAGVFHGLRLRRFHAQRVTSLVNIIERAVHNAGDQPINV